jgi:hypothetical protein
MAYMLPDYSILRPCQHPSGYFSTGGGAGGRIEWIGPDDNVVWDYLFSDETHQQHHDIQPMPNGNVLLIAWERKTEAEAEAAGRVVIQGDMWPTLIVEVEPVFPSGGNIVWEWHLWDHIVQDVDPAKPSYGEIAEHPELMDVNYGNVGGPAGGDWIHANAIDYSEELDQIVFSARATDEFYVIDHSTTTEEAAGRTGGDCGMGGDFLYRWGNPEVYGRGTSDDRQFHAVHAANWIDAGLPGEGNVLVFDNGDRPGFSDDYSVVMEIVLPLNVSGCFDIEPGQPFGPEGPTWSYGGPGGFFGGPTQCGAQRLPNGNTLVCSAIDGRVFEVTEAGAIVWEYDDVVGRLPRAERYWGFTSVPGEAGVPDDSVALLGSFPNPSMSSVSLGFFTPCGGHITFEILSVKGRRVAVLVDGTCEPGAVRLTWDGRDALGREVASGVYLTRIQVDGVQRFGRTVLVR